MQRRISRILGVLLVVCAFQFSASGQRIEVKLLTAFTNPTPEYEDHFGSSLAVLRSNEVVIGATGDNSGGARSGAAYLFDHAGTLLTTFTNPNPGDFNEFGWAVAGLGDDAVVVSAIDDDSGATDTGAAYLFDRTGLLRIAITNPTPDGGDGFGGAMAPFGRDRVLIGATGDDATGPDTGAAYLFYTNGLLLATFTNPVATAGSWFGISLAAVGSDRVLIGASGSDLGTAKAGAAFLFSTNGSLIATFTNPSPDYADRFGASVAAVGTGTILIGAPGEGAGTTINGAAYLFDTNGVLLTALVNTTAKVNESFGYYLTGLGDHRVLISAYADETFAPIAGTAYLFSTNGALLITITNPLAPGAYFGFSVAAAAGENQILIGSRYNGGVGGAYLYEILNPRLALSQDSTNAAVSWISDEPDWHLQWTGSLDTPIAWNDATEPVSTNGLTNLVLQTVPAGVTNRFYRLRRP